MTTANCHSQPLASTIPELSPVICQLHLWVRGLPSVGHFRGHSIHSTGISAAQFFSFDTSVRTKERNRPASAVSAQGCNTLNSLGMNTARPSSSRQVHYSTKGPSNHCCTNWKPYYRARWSLRYLRQPPNEYVSRTFRTLVLGIFKGFFFSPLTSLLHLQAWF